jgi:hypothetical protein
MLLGMLDCTSIHETRQVWRLQDKLMLDDFEKSVLEFQVRTVNGMEAYYWDQVKTVPTRDYNFAENEMKQIQRALEPYLQRWQIPARSRVWLEPLLNQLPEEWVERITRAAEEAAENHAAGAAVSAIR